MKNLLQHFWRPKMIHAVPKQHVFLPEDDDDDLVWIDGHKGGHRGPRASKTDRVAVSYLYHPQEEPPRYRLAISVSSGVMQQAGFTAGDYVTLGFGHNKMVMQLDSDRLGAYKLSPEGKYDGGADSCKGMVVPCRVQVYFSPLMQMRFYNGLWHPGFQIAGNRAVDYVVKPEQHRVVMIIPD